MNKMYSFTLYYNFLASLFAFVSTQRLLFVLQTIYAAFISYTLGWRAKVAKSILKLLEIIV